jgi:hypothetical protein
MFAIGIEYVYTKNMFSGTMGDQQLLKSIDLSIEFKI